MYVIDHISELILMVAHGRPNTVDIQFTVCQMFTDVALGFQKL